MLDITKEMSNAYGYTDKHDFLQFKKNMNKGLFNGQKDKIHIFTVFLILKFANDDY